MIPSTLGFIYTPDFLQVLLITKQRPEFHKGKLNGIGGKSEPGETPLECMVREVKEEADLDIPADNWIQMGSLNWTEWQVTVFATIYTGKTSTIKSLTNDAVAWYPVHKLPPNIISNLAWLIPLGIDILSQKKPPTVTVTYPV